MTTLTAAPLRPLYKRQTLVRLFTVPTFVAYELVNWKAWWWVLNFPIKRWGIKFWVGPKPSKFIHLSLIFVRVQRKLYYFNRVVKRRIDRCPPSSPIEATFVWLPTNEDVPPVVTSALVTCAYSTSMQEMLKGNSTSPDYSQFCRHITLIKFRTGCWSSSVNMLVKLQLVQHFFLLVQLAQNRLVTDLEQL